jgi:hypothetical protein
MVSCQFARVAGDPACRLWFSWASSPVRRPILGDIADKVKVAKRLLRTHVSSAFRVLERPIAPSRAMGAGTTPRGYQYPDHFHKPSVRVTAPATAATWRADTSPRRQPLPRDHRGCCPRQRHVVTCLRWMPASPYARHHRRSVMTRVGPGFSCIVGRRNRTLSSARYSSAGYGSSCSTSRDPSGYECLTRSGTRRGP